MCTSNLEAVQAVRCVNEPVEHDIPRNQSLERCLFIAVNKKSHLGSFTVVYKRPSFSYSITGQIINLGLFTSWSRPVHSEASEILDQTEALGEGQFATEWPSNSRTSVPKPSTSEDNPTRTMDWRERQSLKYEAIMVESETTR